MASNSYLSALLLSITFLLFGCVSHSSAQDDRPGQLAHDLSFSLSISIVAVCTIIMVIVAVILIRRAKKGYFCCLKPRIQYPEVRKATRRVPSRDQEAAPAPAPSYEVHPRGADIAPPDYQDALQDVVVSTGEPQEQVETSNVGDDASVDVDDQTPLNP